MVLNPTDCKSVTCDNLKILYNEASCNQCDNNSSNTCLSTITEAQYNALSQGLDAANLQISQYESRLTSLEAQFTSAEIQQLKDLLNMTSMQN